MLIGGLLETQAYANETSIIGQSITVVSALIRDLLETQAYATETSIIGQSITVVSY